MYNRIPSQGTDIGFTALEFGWESDDMYVSGLYLCTVYQSVDSKDFEDRNEVAEY